MVENHFLSINLEFNFILFFDNHLFPKMTFLDEFFLNFHSEKNHPRKKVAFGIF
jgi:hypothetical protein